MGNHFKYHFYLFSLSLIFFLFFSFFIFTFFRAPISDRSEVSTCFAKVQSYEAGQSDLGLNEVTNKNLKKLLSSMLSVNPKNRPSIGLVQIALNFC